jgi:hypothetical protein
MRTLKEVEEARALFTEAREWSILRWLTEKRRVRTTADRGTAALDDMERSVKGEWSDELRDAYAALVPPSDEDPFAAAEFEFMRQQADGLPEAIKEAARRVKEADDIATEARLATERTFDEAERHLSATLARRGADEAIRAYDLRYKAIGEAEAAGGM